MSGFRIPLIPPPIWYATALVVGVVAKAAGLDRYQTDEGRKYNDENFKRVEEGLRIRKAEEQKVFDDFRKRTR